MEQDQFFSRMWGDSFLHHWPPPNQPQDAQNGVPLGRRQVKTGGVPSVGYVEDFGEPRTTREVVFSILLEARSPFEYSIRIPALSFALPRMTRKSQKANGLGRSLSDVAVRDEAKEGQADTRPQVPRSRRRIRWNTLRIFRGREQSRCLIIVRRSRRANVGQAPEKGYCTGVED